MQSPINMVVGAVLFLLGCLTGNVIVYERLSDAVGPCLDTVKLERSFRSVKCQLEKIAKNDGTNPNINIREVAMLGRWAGEVGISLGMALGERVGAGLRECGFPAKSSRYYDICDDMWVENKEGL